VQGFGFTTFAKVVEADAALGALNGTVIDGRKIEVGNNPKNISEYAF